MFLTPTWRIQKWQILFKLTIPCPPPKARPLSPKEITEVAETCVALFETQGKGIDETLRENGVEAGGCRPKTCRRSGSRPRGCCERETRK